MTGPGTRLRRFGVGAIAAIGLALLPNGASAGGTTLVTGFTTESSGLKAQYKIEVPADWNGTLVLYSHGQLVHRSAAPRRRRRPRHRCVAAQPGLRDRRVGLRESRMVA